MAVLEGYTEIKSSLLLAFTFILLTFLLVEKQLLLLLSWVDEPPAAVVCQWPMGLYGLSERIMRSTADENHEVLEQNICSKTFNLTLVWNI